MNFRLTTINKTTTLIKGLNDTLARMILWPEWPFGQRHFGQRDSLASVNMAGDTLADDTLADNTLARVTLANDTLVTVILWPEWHFGQVFFASFGGPKGEKNVSLAKVSFWPKCNSANKRMKKKIAFLTCSCRFLHPNYLFQVKKFWPFTVQMQIPT